MRQGHLHFLPEYFCKLLLSPPVEQRHTQNEGKTQESCGLNKTSIVLVCKCSRLSASVFVSLIMQIHKVTVAACWVSVFYYLFSAFHENVGMADSAIKSQGALSTQLSVSMIGWLFLIDGAWPTGRPPKSIQTAGKDEMAVGT